MSIDQIIAEDNIRRLRFDTPYDPVRGIGCIGKRTEVATPVESLPTAYIPDEMLDDPSYPLVTNNPAARQRLRCRYDFEYWCATCVIIKHKTEGRDTPFILNTPQRRVAAILEDDRKANLPIRMILLKARQWGGSTLIQIYMAWIQSCHRRNWNSLICAHVKDTASGIRGMYSKLLSSYPEHLWDGDAKPQFKPYERSVNVREITGRGCRVTVGSSESQEAVRGADYAMAHLSETAFWASTSQHSPDKFIRAVCGAIALIPYSLIVMESTANGVGNYFHSEWLRCKDGRGDKRAVFVPWHEIEIYRLTPPDRRALAATLTDYEQKLWQSGCSLDQIYWYRKKAAEYPDHAQMKAEFPTTDLEAFINTGSGVFNIRHIERLRQQCLDAEIGDIDTTTKKFVNDKQGAMKIWQRPEKRAKYIVTVDVGGRSSSSDWSVIAVIRHPNTNTPQPEVVAQWRAHTDHDILTRKCVAIAAYYNHALLVVESNTLETAESTSDANLFILNRLSSSYSNLYMRTTYDSLARKPTRHIGFHTNRSTKSMVINTLIEAVRDCAYIEHDNEACNELTTYEQQPNGVFAAKAGYHDDILMTRAIALHIISGTQASHPFDPSTSDIPYW